LSWIADRMGVTLEWLREVPGVDTARVLPEELWERLRELPGVDVLMAAPRTWNYVARSMLPARDGEYTGEIPRPVATPGLALSVFADELVGAVLRSVRLTPSHEEIWRIARESETALRRLDLGGMLAEPARFHPRPPPLERPFVEKLRAFGQEYERISFPSDYVPLADLPGHERWLDYESNSTARAYVLRHSDGPRPWVVCLHGFGMGAPRDLMGFRSFRIHRELGVNVIHPVFPLHGPRREGRFSGDGVISLDFAANLHGVGQAVWDVRRCLSWIRAQGATRIGIHGISLGGYLCGLVAGLEAGLDCVIAGIPPADLALVMARHSPRVVRQMARHEGLLGQTARDLHRVISPLSFQPRLPRERRFIYAGIVDRMSTPRHAHMLWRHWERPSIQWYRGSHVGFVWSPEVWRYVATALRSSGIVHT